MITRFENRNVAKQDSMAYVGRQMKENIICDVVRIGTFIDKSCL